MYVNNIVTTEVKASVLNLFHIFMVQHYGTDEQRLEITENIKLIFTKDRTKDDIEITVRLKDAVPNIARLLEDTSASSPTLTTQPILGIFSLSEDAESEKDSIHFTIPFDSLRSIVYDPADITAPSVGLSNRPSIMDNLLMPSAAAATYMKYADICDMVREFAPALVFAPGYNVEWLENAFYEVKPHFENLMTRAWHFRSTAKAFAWDPHDEVYVDLKWFTEEVGIPVDYVGEVTSEYGDAVIYVPAITGKRDINGGVKFKRMITDSSLLRKL